MYNREVFSISVALVLLLLTFGPGPARAGPVTYQVSVNTAALSGQSGNLDFQFNPGSSSAESATATVTNFQTIGGVLSQPATLTGDATGSLPSTLTLVNGTAFNDVFQGFTYGNSLGFLLTLSGQAIDSPGGTFGSSFALSLYDAAGITPLLTTDPFGSVLTVNLNANGITSTETFPQSPMDNTPVAAASPANAVPEPATIVMLISAVPVVLFAWRRSRKRRLANRH